MKKILLFILFIGLGFSASLKAQDNSQCVLNTNNAIFTNGGLIPIPDYDGGDIQFSYIVRSGDVSIREGQFGLSIYGSGSVDFQITYYNIVGGNCSTIVHNYTGEFRDRSGSGSGSGKGDPQDLKEENGGVL